MRISFLIVLTLSGLFGCGPERYSWNERTTVTVQTPNGIVTGTSVIEFRAAWCEEGCGLAGDISYQWDYTGEAVVVEVLPDRYLFVLPGTYLADAHRYAPEVLGRYNNTGERLRNARDLTEPVVLPPEAYPEMLTFLEWGDVDTMRSVDPTNLAEAFGDGVVLNSITLEVTGDHVSEPQLEDLLSWSCEPLRLDNGRTRAFRVPNQSPRGWYSVGSFDFGRPLSICEATEPQ